MYKGWGKLWLTRDNLILVCEGALIAKMICTMKQQTLILLSIPEESTRCPDLGNSLIADTLLWPALVAE